MRTPRTSSSQGLSRTFCHGCFSGSLFMEGGGDAGKIAAPRADAAQHHREEKDTAGHGHEAAEAHENAGPKNGRMWYKGPATKTSFPRAGRKSRMRMMPARDVASHQARVLDKRSAVMPNWPSMRLIW